MAGPPASLPMIIQGGMGVGVSNWRLARAVSSAGHLGVVSGVALDAVLARRLQAGDPDALVRQALSQFPYGDVAEQILQRYYVSGGLPPDAAFRPSPRLGVRPNLARDQLIIAGNFVEVYLAKHGHGGLVGINYLEKIQLTIPAAVYGAMLAGVDYVLVGAGIPAAMPGLLDRLARGEPVEYEVAVAGSVSGERHTVHCDPTAFGDPVPLRRPRFLAIISSAILATYLARDAATRPDGFVLETSVAGGHSAPPRGALRLTEAGEPEYGPRDDIDLAKVAATGLPYWLAGGHGGEGSLSAALGCGAAGIQVGTAFALSRDSGLDPGLRQRLVDEALAGTLVVRNEPYASPTGFPFKVAQLAGTLSDEDVYSARDRLCDLGYLRTPYRRAGGEIGYRCSAEPVVSFQRKGGDIAETAGRRCLCNGLMASIGLGQRHGDDGADEPPLLTLGQDVGFLKALVDRAGRDFGAEDVVAYLAGPLADVGADEVGDGRLRSA